MTFKIGSILLSTEDSYLTIFTMNDDADRDRGDDASECSFEND